MRSITDTGIRGYLKWLQQDQPNVYALVAPQIAQRFPQAFSDHEQSMALGALSDDGGAGTTYYYGDTPEFPTSASSPAAPDVASVANTGPTSPSLVSGLIDLVNQGFQAASKYQLTQAQIAQINNVNQQQAQHIAAGNNPLMISTTSLGIPFISGVSTQTAVGGTVGLAAVGGIAFLLYMLGKKKHAT